MCDHASFDAAIMPTISSSNIPTPKSWGEFEDIVLAAAKLRWNATDFFRNGRQGQKQDGVDVWGHDDDRHIGIQCKNTIDGITLSVIKKEMTNAGAFFATARSALYRNYGETGRSFAKSDPGALKKRGANAS